MNRPEWWDRFREKIDVLGKCWNWMSALDDKGYGVFYIDGKNKKAHRLVYELKCGPIPDGFDVCHHCDNPRCVNPEHLFLGVDKDNQRDSISKGRNAFGERHGRSKITDEIAAEIKNSPLSQVKLAKIYGLNQSTIGQIKRGQNWKHVKSRREQILEEI
jgi:hypothetical protein